MTDHFDVETDDDAAVLVDALVAAMRIGTRIGAVELAAGLAASGGHLDLRLADDTAG